MGHTQSPATKRRWSNMDQANVVDQIAGKPCTREKGNMGKALNRLLQREPNHRQQDKSGAARERRSGCVSDSGQHPLVCRIDSPFGLSTEPPLDSYSSHWPSSDTPPERPTKELNRPPSANKPGSTRNQSGPCAPTQCCPRETESSKTHQTRRGVRGVLGHETKETSRLAARTTLVSS